MTTIRQAEPRDLAEITRLHRREGESHGRLDPGLMPGSGHVEQFRKALRPVLGRRLHPIFVAQEDDGGRLSGCIIGRVVHNRPFAVRGYGHISCFHVNEDKRAERVGRQLFAALGEAFRAEGLEAAQVDVACHDPARRRFWLERGFTYFLDHLYRDAEPPVTGDVDSSVLARPGDVGDVDAVLSLWEEMMEYHAALDGRLKVLPEERGYVEQAIRYWAGDDASSLPVAEADGSVVGFALGGLVETALGLTAGAYGHIAHMCVTARWRRRGIGRRLFRILREWFWKKGLPSIHIYVSRFSSVSQLFWRGLGFESYIERLWCDL